MKKDQLLELASFGVRHKVRLIEQQLAGMWKLFPTIFLGDGPPQLLRPEPRGASSNGHWPTLLITPPDTDEAGTPTPKHKRGTKKKKKKNGKLGNIDLNAYQRLYDHVEQHPGSTLTEIANAIGVHPANVRGKVLLGLKHGFFTKKDDGYHAKAAPLG